MNHFVAVMIVVIVVVTRCLDTSDRDHVAR